MRNHFIVVLFLIKIGFEQVESEDLVQIFVHWIVVDLLYNCWYLNYFPLICTHSKNRISYHFKQKPFLLIHLLIPQLFIIWNLSQWIFQLLMEYECFAADSKFFFAITQFCLSFLVRHFYTYQIILFKS